MVLALIYTLTTLTGVYITLRLCYAELVRPHNLDYDCPREEQTHAT